MKWAIPAGDAVSFVKRNGLDVVKDTATSTMITQHALEAMAPGYPARLSVEASRAQPG